ncbi:MAG: hypothetical protein NZT92_17005 [Abditibacteriales bacterium]|nr:hypothetical protein [Abditibacteriales bacterium]MDW8367099.1 hypothetical protein [Abditibacteriales bacterium]
MDSTVFDRIQQAFIAEGATAALERLITALREEKEYAYLFHALLLKARHELGLPLLSSHVEPLDEETQRKYNDAYIAAYREVGELFLQAGDIPQAWVCFRAIGEPQKVRDALERVEPSPDNLDTFIQIAYHEGAHPRKGFEWILQHYGECSAITYYSQYPPHAEGKQECGAMLVRHLHALLVHRVKHDIKQIEGDAPDTDCLAELVRGRDYLFANNSYHVDPSHLSSVVQHSVELKDVEVLRLAADLTEYGKRLSSMYHYEGPPPFQNLYEDCGIYLRALSGDAVEEGIAHFRRKVEQSNPQEEGTGAAQMFVYLLTRLQRLDDAIEVSRVYLADVPEDQLFCASIPQLCQMSHNYRRLMEIAKERENPLVFTAGLLMSGETSRG